MPTKTDENAIVDGPGERSVLCHVINADLMTLRHFLSADDY